MRKDVLKDCLIDFLNENVIFGAETAKVHLAMILKNFMNDDLNDFLRGEEKERETPSGAVAQHRPCHRGACSTSFS